MQEHLVLPGKRRNLADFIGRIDRTQFGRLSNADHSRLVRMQFVLACQRRFHFVQIQLSVLSSSRNQLGATCEKFAGAAFVIFNVRVLVTENAVKWLAELGQGKRVRSGAVKGKINIAIRLEEFSHPVAHPFCPLIITIRGDGLIFVHFFKSGPCFWTKPRRVIAGEFVAAFRHHVPELAVLFAASNEQLAA